MKRIDNKRIEGTLSDMLEEAMAFCVRNMRTRTIIDLNTEKHVNKTESCGMMTTSGRSSDVMRLSV